MSRVVIVIAVIAAAAAFGSAETAQAAIPPIEACNVNVYCRTIQLTFRPPPSPSVAGNGRITSQPEGLDCTYHGAILSGRCEWQFTWPFGQQGTVRLSLVADADSEASGSAIADLSLAPSPYRPDAEFRLKRYPLEVSRSGAGTGRVTTTSGGIDCGAVCKATFNHGTAVTVNAAPDAGAEFRGWTGACAGQGATCSVTLTAPRTTNAVFELRSSSPQPQPQPQPSPQPEPDTNVRAEVLGHKLGRSVLGFRLVQIELELDERLAATVTLTRGRRALLTKRIPSLGLGRRVVTLVLPNGIAKGRARLTLQLRDADGNTRSWSRSVLIGRSGK